MGKVMKHFGAEPDDVRQACVFPHPPQGRGEFTLIEDDGVTLGYQHGEYSQVRLSVVAEPDSIWLSAQANGDYALPYKTVEFILPTSETRRVDAKGETWVDAKGQKHIQLDCQA